MNSIKIAIIGVGNCASALIQGIHYYRSKTKDDAIGLMHWNVGGYLPEHIEVVAAFDIDRRKVGQPIHKAIHAAPNCIRPISGIVPPSGTTVQMGRILDGVADHMHEYAQDRTFLPSDQAQADKNAIVEILKASGAEILLNYLPVGSEEATRFYADCALSAGTAFINNIPVFIASDEIWADRFAQRGLPLIGDDIKSQIGATITHRILTDLFNKRGVKLERTYQLNTGGNTDFLNMLNRERLSSKKKSKTEAVQSVAGRRLEDDNIHIGPSDYVPWQNDNKVCFIRMEGKVFGDIPMNLELRLSVEDSPNSGGVTIDAIRCAKLALDRGIGGVLEGPSAYFCKHPPHQFSDDEAYHLIEKFVAESKTIREIAGYRPAKSGS